MNFVDNFISSHKPKQIVNEGENKSYLVGGSSKKGFLIFPGSGQDALSCFDLIDAFEKDYKAIAVNYDGFYSVESFFEYINKILEQEKVTSTVLYGLSIGGFLAQHYVRKYGHKVERLIISHAGTTRSKTIIRRVAIPGKIIYPILPLIPQKILNNFLKRLAGRVQSGDSNFVRLYEKYSSPDNLQTRMEFARKSSFSMANKSYLKSVYKLGIDMERLEKRFTNHDLDNWHGKILIIRTDNDPLAQDDGVFKEYYPTAKVVTFYKTGHLTPFIRFEEMVNVIKKFL